MSIAVAFYSIQHLMETDGEWDGDTTPCRQVLLVVRPVVVGMVDIMLVLDDDVAVLRTDVVGSAGSVLLVRCLQRDSRL